MEPKRYSIKRLLMASLTLAMFATAIHAQQKASDPSKLEAVKPRQSVVIIGAVRSPSRFEFRENVRLKEIIECAGGLTNTAGRSLQIRNSEEPRCGDCSGVDFAELPGLYNLAAVMSDEESSNPMVHAGDIIDVWESEPIFVTGAVVHPQAISSKGAITVKQAVALAGGVTKFSKSKRIKIYRQAQGSSELTIVTVDLKSITKGRVVDPVLQPFDIVEVPEKHHGDHLSGPSDAFQELPMLPIC